MANCNASWWNLIILTEMWIIFGYDPLGVSIYPPELIKRLHFGQEERLFRT